MSRAVWSSLVLATLLLSTIEAMVTFGPAGKEVIDYSGTQQREGPGTFVIQGEEPTSRSRANNECELPMDPGSYTEPQIRYYYNKLNGQCTIFTYYGRGGNLNNFPSMSACNKRCICSRNLSAGICDSKMPRYFYNQATGLCQLFSYSGCGFNANNFATKAECAFVCAVPSETKPRCFRRPEFGSCSDYILRYYYDAQCGCCRQFIYSGCEGNANNFETEQICLNRCGNENVNPAGGDSAAGSTSSAASSETGFSTSSMVSPASPTAATTLSPILQILNNTGPDTGRRLGKMIEQMIAMFGR